MVKGSKVDMELGRAVLVELAMQTEVEVQVGLSYEAAALDMGVNLCNGARSEAPGL